MRLDIVAHANREALIAQTLHHELAVSTAAGFDVRLQFAYTLSSEANLMGCAILGLKIGRSVPAAFGDARIPERARVRKELYLGGCS